MAALTRCSLVARRCAALLLVLAMLPAGVQRADAQPGAGKIKPIVPPGPSPIPVTGGTPVPAPVPVPGPAPGLTPPGGLPTKTPAPKTPYATTSTSFTLYQGSATRIAVPVNRPGLMNLTVDCSGPELVVRLLGPNGFSQESRGAGAVTLPHQVTGAEASAGAVWTVSISAAASPLPTKGGGTQAIARGTLRISAPVPEPVSANNAMLAARRNPLPAKLAQLVTSPLAVTVTESPQASGTQQVPPASLLQNFPKQLNGTAQLAAPQPVAGLGRKGRQLPQAPVPHLDRITLCQPEYYPNGPFRDVTSLPNPNAWVMIHGSNLTGAWVWVHLVPSIGGSRGDRMTDPYNGLGRSDSLLSFCLLAGNTCFSMPQGSLSHGEVYVTVDGRESNRLPFQFTGTDPFYYIICPEAPTDSQLGGDGDVTASSTSYELDPSLQPFGFDWPANTTPDDSWRSEEKREFWKSILVFHSDKPTQHSASAFGQTVNWSTANSDRGTDTFFDGVTLPGGYRIEEVRIDPVLDQFSDLFGFARVVEDHPRTQNAKIRIDWSRAPGVNLVYQLRVMVSGPQWCDPQHKLVRP